MTQLNHFKSILQENKFYAGDFIFEFPVAKQAEYPVAPRDMAKLMILDRHSQTLEHRIFQDLTDYFAPNDVLVLNNAKVLPARFHTRKKETGDSIDVFLLRELTPNVWEAKVHPARKVRIGNTLIFTEEIQCDVIDNTVSSGRVVKFYGENRVQDTLQEIGIMPFPPYIMRDPEPIDRERYQTVYANSPGAVAVPSAGMHFTTTLLDRLRARGVEIVEITLHQGMGFYKPVTVSEMSRHHAQSEHYIIGEQAARAINAARSRGNRIIAAGSSTVRALESSQFEGEKIVPRDRWTDLFIYPPFHFNVVDGLITNFHHSQSKTLILQSAFHDVGSIINAIDVARTTDYRVGSFGDAMLII